MNNLKDKFSIFKNYKKENGEDLVYIDSSASSLTPDSVVEKMSEYYFGFRSNIDRAISKISLKATEEYNNSRKILADYLNCDEEDLIWTSGATSSSNILIDMISLHDDEYKFLNEGDEILTSIAEHHSSLLPLQKLARNKKLKLKFLELNDKFELDIEEIRNLVSEKTKIVSISLVSNVLGGINDLEKIVGEIKKINPKVFIISDMTAAFGHMSIDMGKMRNYIDAGYFSFHKAFGPTGVGVLFIKRELSRNMNPSIVGGGIVSHVEKEDFKPRSDIKVFEAGTPNIAGVIGAGEAVLFLEGIREISLDHTQNLVSYLSKNLKSLEDEKFKVNIFARDAKSNVGIVSFQIFVNDKEVHPHDIADILSRYNISVRVGHHCAEPLMTYFDVPSGLTRASFHVYNEEKDIDSLIEAIKKIKEIFGK